MKTYTEQELRDAYQKGAIYSLIEIRRNDIRETVMVSEKKKKLVDYINEKTYDEYPEDSYIKKNWRSIEYENKNYSKNLVEKFAFVSEKRPSCKTLPVI